MSSCHYAVELLFVIIVLVEFRMTCAVIAEVVSSIKDIEPTLNKKRNIINTLEFKPEISMTLNKFQNKFQCNKDENYIQNWHKRMKMYNIQTSNIYSTACYISEYDNKYPHEIPLRWNEQIGHCSYVNTSYLPIKFKNPVFFIQIKDSKVYISWPGMNLRYSELRLSQRTQHSLLLIDYVLNFIEIKSASFFLSTRDTPVVPRFIPIVAIGQGASSIHSELAFPQYLEVLNRFRYYPNPPGVHTESIHTDDVHTESTSVHTPHTLNEDENDSESSTVESGNRIGQRQRQRQQQLKQRKRKRALLSSQSGSPSRIMEDREVYKEDFLRKVPKLVWAGSMQPFNSAVSRWLLLNLASQYPDLIEVHPTNCEGTFGSPNIIPVPLQQHVKSSTNNYNGSSSVDGGDSSDSSSYIPICNNKNTSLSLVEQAKKYQFHISLPGNGASGRTLSQIALHCGVLLLPDDRYYLTLYEGKFKPWIHFVPIDPDLSDLVETLQWLIMHPKESSIIASNLRYFSLNYGRLEDWICYSAFMLNSPSFLKEVFVIHIPFNSINRFGSLCYLESSQYYVSLSIQKITQATAFSSISFDFLLVN
eukprot:gene4469-8901_t